MGERGYYGGWGAFLILLSSSVTVYGILANVLYALALLAIGLGAFILSTLYGRGGRR